MKNKYLVLTFLASLLTLSSCNINKPEVNDNNSSSNQDNSNNNDNNNSETEENENSKIPVDQRVNYSENKTWIVDGKDTFVKHIVQEGQETPFKRYTDAHWYSGNEAEWICDYVDGKLPYKIIHYVTFIDGNHTYLEGVKMDVEHNNLLPDLSSLEKENMEINGYLLNGNKIDIKTFKVVDDLKIIVDYKEIAIDTTIEALAKENIKHLKDKTYESPLNGKIVRVKGTVIKKMNFNLYLANVVNNEAVGTINCYNGQLDGASSDLEGLRINDYVEVVGKFLFHPTYGPEIAIDNYEKDIKCLATYENNTNKLDDLDLTYEELVNFYKQDKESLYMKSGIRVSCSTTFIIHDVVQEERYINISLQTLTGANVTEFKLLTHLSSEIVSSVGKKIKFKGQVYFEGYKKGDVDSIFADRVIDITIL